MALPKLKPLFKKRKSDADLVGIDLTDDHVKVVHVRVSQLRREVANLAVHETRGKSDEEVAGLIRDSVKKFGAEGGRAFLTVPMNVVITRTIEIPSRDPDEIREIVNLQASRHTPYSRAEIIIDMLYLGVVRDNYTRVLLVIVPKETVVRQIRILETLGLRLEKVFFPPEGLSSACSKILGADQTDDVYGIVHMDVAFTTFFAIQQGKILFVRGIAIGADNLLDEKDVYNDRFVDELQKSLDTYLADEAGPVPSKLLLTGVVAENTELDGLFNETLHIPLKHQAYLNHFSISGAARQAASANPRVSFFNVVAPLLLFDRMQIDLTSDERKLKLELERRARLLVQTGILAMLILSLVFAGFVSKLFFKRLYYQKLVERYKPAREEAKNLELLYAKAQVVKEYLATRGESIEVLSALYDTLPEDVRVAGFKYDEGAKFTVRGTSSTMASVFEFVTNLEKSDKFKNVKTKYVTARNEEGRDLADFEITSQVERKGAPR